MRTLASSGEIHHASQGRCFRKCQDVKSLKPFSLLANARYPSLRSSRVRDSRDYILPRESRSLAPVGRITRSHQMHDIERTTIMRLLYPSRNTRYDRQGSRERPPRRGKCTLEMTHPNSLGGKTCWMRYEHRTRNSLEKAAGNERQE